MPDFEFLLTLKLRRAATAAVSQPKRPDRLRCRIQAQPLLGHVLFLELTRQKRSITSLLWATLDDRSLSSWRIGCLHINICSCDAKTSDPSRCVPSSLHMPTTSCFTCIYTIFFFGYPGIALRDRQRLEWRPESGEQPMLLDGRH